ncbi:phosphatidylethanolamine-binding protein [Neurospora tetraspora]|uniref:Large ribosomal subunit protein mL38 n=1 Tax=Neurospora tetraspora TaxID=94610 RepID=A0AAE0JKX0_9PEZI|nr:phosphatidylethanolamine-binding protein [Neurospora tetraspora]
MSTCQQVARPLVRCLRQAGPGAATCSTRSVAVAAVRPFSSTPMRKDEGTTTTTTPSADSTTTTTPPPPPPSATEAKAAVADTVVGGPELGSRRRRAALATTGNLPFEQLPYQAFQEARKILQQDRAAKIAQIVKETEKIKLIEARDASEFEGGEAAKQTRIKSLRNYIEELKILADINDPEVKRRFEDGRGDMTKPVYRVLAERRWRSMDYKIIAQRISQFHVVPDLLPAFDPTMDVKLSFRGYQVSPGAILDSRVTEVAPTLRMQVFDKGERLLTVVVIDSDVPDVTHDNFKRRCHFLAANIPWDPSKTVLSLRSVGDRVEGDVGKPWLPPFAQKGSPYHRLNVFVLEQKPGAKIDGEALRKHLENRENFSLKGFREKFDLEPVGFNLFRSEWDEGTAEVMERHGIPGAEVEFKRQKFASLKPPRKARGWEAKRQKPKYKSLWKYVKRIA